MKRLITICSLVSFFGPAIVQADITVYTDEASYLSALGALPKIVEGFEGTDWDVTRVPSSVSTLTTQGITWTASDLLTTISAGTGSGWVRTGNWGVFDSYGDPDMIATSGPIDFLGAGGWFAATTAGTINFEINGQVVATRSLPGPHVFLGIVDPAGFSSVKFATPSGHWGADDFTFAVVPVPGAILLGILGLGAAGIKLRKFA